MVLDNAEQKVYDKLLKELQSNNVRFLCLGIHAIGQLKSSHARPSEDRLVP